MTPWAPPPSPSASPVRTQIFGRISIQVRTPEKVKAPWSAAMNEEALIGPDSGGARNK